MRLQQRPRQTHRNLPTVMRVALLHDACRRLPGGKFWRGDRVPFRTHPNLVCNDLAIRLRCLLVSLALVAPQRDRPATQVSWPTEYNRVCFARSNTWMFGAESS